jgi:cation:H+ antiporter
MATHDQHGPAVGAAARSSWVRHLLVASLCAALGLAVHAVGTLLPSLLTTVGLGVGLIGASFLLAWAADAGEAVFSGGLVLAAVALVGVLPEFTIEVHLAFIQQADLVTANLTGATRLLLTGAIALPLLAAFDARRRGRTPPAIRVAGHRRLELGVLLVAAVFAIQVVIRGSLTVIDGILLLALYVLYARRVQGTPDEQPAVAGVPAGLLSLPPSYRRPAVTALIAAAAAVVVTIASPFTHALLATGSSLGIDPYLMIQFVVPIATEAPEVVVVAVLVANRRPAQGLALFLASSVSQWTLGLGSLPVAYLAGGGGFSLPMAGREQLELALTGAITLFVVAALATLRPVRVDALIAGAAYAAQAAWPAPFIRFAAAFVLAVFAVNLLMARRHEIRPLLRAAFGRDREAAGGGGR